MKVKMKLIYFLAVLLAFPAFAQDGSAGLAPSASQPRAATTSAATPRGNVPQATVTPTVTPTPVAQGEAEPVSITLPPVEMELVQTEEDENASPYNIIAGAAAIVLALGGYAAYKLKTKKSEKKDDSRCFNLKKMMEDKLRELTDLRGQIKSKSKEKVREKVRESLKGTSAGEILAKIESVEKEYARIKQLYEKCVIEFSRKKTILVDAVYSFVDTHGKIFKEMHDLLEKYQNKKILLTGADDRQFKEWGLDKMPYEVFTLKHNPEKANSEYYKKMLEHFSLDKEEVIYFEHDQGAAKSAESAGIKTYFYDSSKKDLIGLKKFLDENL